MTGIREGGGDDSDGGGEDGDDDVAGSGEKSSGAMVAERLFRVKAASMACRVTRALIATSVSVVAAT